MAQKAVIKTIILSIALAAVLSVFAGGAADARSGKVRNEYATTKLPVWRVGQLNKKLSELCRKGLFTQRRSLGLSIGYIGKIGQGITGIAQKYWNLRDELGVAEADKTYHFFNQGYSNCRVYVAKTPLSRLRR